MRSGLRYGTYMLTCNITYKLSNLGYMFSKFVSSPYVVGCIYKLDMVKLWNIWSWGQERYK